MIILENNTLKFRFPEVHEKASCSIAFQRTLRIPDDDRNYPLPPGLGTFPLRHVDDFASRLPDAWHARGGVLAPMYQAEAMWINFSSDYPFAVKVATGKICAITGDPWVDHLNREPQDYVVLPDQPWLDGYCIEKGVIRQFVAMPLGMDYTAEEQMTGKAIHGGLQLVAYPMKAKSYEKMMAERSMVFRSASFSAACASAGYSVLGLTPMGLAPGGRMKQQIYDDPKGLDAWDQRHGSRCFVSLVNTVQWMAITGERPPTEPPTARDYATRGLPWFDYYGADAKAVDGSEKLRGLKSIAKKAEQTGQGPLPENETFAVPHVVTLGDRRLVRECAGELR